MKAAVCLMLTILGVGACPGSALGFDKLYWADYYLGIRSADLDGTHQGNVVTGLGWMYAMTADVEGGKIYWEDAGNKRIQRANLDGTQVETLGSTPGTLSVRGMAVDASGGKLYWAQGGSVFRCDLDGSEREAFLTSGGYFGLTIFGEHLYYSDYTLGTINRIDLNGTDRQTIVSGLVGPRYLDIDPVRQDIYWTEFDHLRDYETGRIKRANLDGTEVQLLVDRINTSYPLAGIAVDYDDQKMYWLQSYSLRQANLDGTSITTLDGVSIQGYNGAIVLVPEPATLSLLALGGLAMLRRRR